MKSIQEIEAMMLEYVTVGNPEAKSETIELFPGLSIEFDNEVDSDDPFAFLVLLTFAGFSAHTVYNPSVGVSLSQELTELAVFLREKIENGAAKCVRDKIKGILHI